MSVLGHDLRDNLYRWAVWLLITTSLATVVGRIAAVRATTGETPMLSANDRSRWCTIRALVEDGSYVIDRLVATEHPKTGRRHWKSIDMVRHRGWDGREHYYSSKPTLLPTLLAAQYWMIRAASGATLGEQPFVVMRMMLVITNVVPLLVYFVVLWRLVDRVTSNRGAALYVMGAATWGTFLTTFAVTINNHLVAAIAVLLATALTWHIWLGERSWWYFAGAGLCAAFAAANELPALSFVACVAAAAWWRSWPRTLLAFVPAALLVAAGLLGTTYLAHGTIKPAYAHRSDGPVVATVPMRVTPLLDQKTLPSEVREALRSADFHLSEEALVWVAQPQQRWGIWDRVGQQRLALVATEQEIEIRRWDNWYDYAGSYWTGAQQGVDRGEPSRAVYLWHVLLGHHGIFSLTPLWLLVLPGIVWLLRSRQPGSAPLACMVIVLSVLCVSFYVGRPVIDRNYGGVSCGLRWAFWLIPLWLLCLIPTAERWLQTASGRAAALALLMLSTFSAAYASANPWSHPWLFQLGTYAGWWHY